MPSTSNLCEEWKNHLFTLRKHNISQKLVVFPLDNNAKKCVQKRKNQNRYKSFE